MAALWIKYIIERNETGRPLTRKRPRVDDLSSPFITRPPEEEWKDVEEEEPGNDEHEEKEKRTAANNIKSRADACSATLRHTDQGTRIVSLTQLFPLRKQNDYTR